MLEDRFHPLLDRFLTARDRVALVTADTVWSFGDLGAAVARFRRAFGNLPDGPVLFHGHKEPDIVAAMLAAIWSGRGYVFADASNPRARLETIYRTAEAVCAVSFAGDDLPPNMPRLNPQDLPDEDPSVPCAPPAPVPGERLLYVTMTSGSTGTPKGVRVTRDNFDAFLAWFGPLCDTCRGHGAGHVNHANLAFDMSASDLWPALFGGRAVYPARPPQQHQFKGHPAPLAADLRGRRFRAGQLDLDPGLPVDDAGRPGLLCAGTACAQDLLCRR